MALKLLQEGHTKVAKVNSIKKTNHSQKHELVLRNHQEIKLYADEIHPSPCGAFLNACVFYKFITGKNTVSLKFNAKLTTQDASVLKEIGDQ